MRSADYIHFSECSSTSLIKLDIDGSDGRGGVLRSDLIKEGVSIALCKMLWGKDGVSTAAMMKFGCTADVQ